VGRSQTFFVDGGQFLETGERGAVNPAANTGFTKSQAASGRRFIAGWSRISDIRESLTWEGKVVECGADFHNKKSLRFAAGAESAGLFVLIIIT